MKITLHVVAASALLGPIAVTASSIHDRHHAHEALHKLRRDASKSTQGNVTCGCTTYYTTYWGEPTLIQPAPANTTVAQPTTYSQANITVSPTSVAPSSYVAAAGSSIITSALSSAAYTPASTSSSAVATTSDTSTYSSPANSSSSASSTYSSPSGSSSAAGYSSSISTQSSSSSQYSSSSSAPSSSSFSVYYASSSSLSSSSSVYYAPSSSSSSSSSVYYAPSSSSSSTPSVYYAPTSSSIYNAPSSSAYSAPPTASPTSSVSTGGSTWCMTYTPYIVGGCKDATTVKNDIATIASKGFTCLRLYSTDCFGLQNVADNAISHGMKLILGVYIDKTGPDAAKPQVNEIANWIGGNQDSVKMVVVGNEAIFNHFTDASSLATFVGDSKQTLKGKGYTGPVTTCETMDILKENKATLCPVVDVPVANIHPFFNSSCTPEEAGPMVADNLETLKGICGHDDAYNLETGWPNAGEDNGSAKPSEDNQKRAIRSIQQAAGDKSVFFSFEDDMWKEPGYLNVEQHWGCHQVFGQ